MIIITKSFSEGQIDISHLSPAAQKRIIANERKKIELDQKISDTKNSIGELRQRASMSIADNARIGAMKMRRNPMVGFASSVGGMTLSQNARSKVGDILSKPKVGEVLTKISPKLADSNLLSNASIIGTSMLAYRAIPWASGIAGRVGGAIRGMTAKAAARRKERKLVRLAKKRAQLGE